jgi:hypothetical protein
MDFHCRPVGHSLRPLSKGAYRGLAIVVSLNVPQPMAGPNCVQAEEQLALRHHALRSGPAERPKHAFPWRRWLLELSAARLIVIRMLEDVQELMKRPEVPMC